MRGHRRRLAGLTLAAVAMFGTAAPSAHADGASASVVAVGVITPGTDFTIKNLSGNIRPAKFIIHARRVGQPITSLSTFEAAYDATIDGYKWPGQTATNPDATVNMAPGVGYITADGSPVPTGTVVITP